MDGESSYESDISESWSLIDINLNEESPSVTDASEIPLSKLENEKIEKSDGTEVEDFVRKCKERNKTEFNRTSDSDCGGLYKGQDVEPCGVTDDNFPSKKSFSDDDGKDDSGDNESIEILELDGSCQDSELDRLDSSGIDQLDNFTYQSDDEESLEGKTNAENGSNNSTVIRRRKRLSKTPETTVHSVNSENKSAKDGVEAFTNVTEQPSGANNPVYKHYRNNVVNTVLSLSVGVIFAGVACLAIGHFLGVQDASETAVELAETLKKLQKENAALQSALLTLEMNSKLELPLNQPHEVPFQQAPQVDPSRNQVTDSNKAALSAGRSSLNSNEWLSRIRSRTGKNNEMKEREDGGDFSGLGKYILDHVHSLNRRMEEGAKFFEDTDKKISKYLQRIIRRLSSSQDNIEILHERLFKLKDKLNNKLDKVSSFPGEIRPERATQKRVPVTELELQTMQWNPESKTGKSSRQDYRKSILFYNFPQPEKYYENNPTGNEFELPNSNRTLKNDKQDNKKRKNEEKKKGKKQKKSNWKEKSKDKKEKGEKKRKRAVNKYEKVLKNFEKSRKKDKSGRLTFSEVAFNVTRPQTKRHPRIGDKGTKFKRKCKKSKHTKLKKVLLSNLKKGSFSKKNQYRRLCSGSQCFNLTGDWVFRWAGGREEFRRLQTAGDWQFDRAKARKDQRVSSYDENWQFKRAVAREYNRWNRDKYEKYFGKDFSHERFSWV